MIAVISRACIQFSGAACFGLAAAFFSTVASAQFVQFPEGEFPLTNYKESSVALEEIMTGGPPRDGIPSIDSPRFVGTAEASTWLQDPEPVIALQLKGSVKAYPLQILMYHEIVNDEIANVPVAVTFCPLCNASIVFERALGSGESADVLDFGTTGRLRKSDLVMYDRQTESWWQQFTGKAIIGDYNGTELVRIPSQIISFGEFRNAFPEADVLSRETGHRRFYGRNPYSGYDNINNNPFLFRGEIDSRLPAMERVLSIGSENNTQLVPLSHLLDVPVANLRVDDKAIVVFAVSTAASALDKAEIAESRAVPAAAAFDASPSNFEDALTFVLQDGVIKDEQTNSQWNAFGLSTAGELKGSQLKQLDDGVHFAFAWLAFDPDSDIITPE